MIRYQLECDLGHSFEAWFQNSKAYDAQAKGGLVSCPTCHSTDVRKALMAPNIGAKSNTKEETRGSGASREGVGTSAQQAGGSGQVAASPRGRKEVVEAMRKLRELVTENSDYVGPRFAEEARRMHYDEVERKSIYGEASVKDVKDLHDEGIECHPLPILPEDQN